MKILLSIYKIIKKISKLFGFNLVIKKINIKSDKYEPIFPSANYAPWLKDIQFNSTFDKIKDHTLVDKYRCYELWQLVAETVKLEGALIEIGAWRGGTGVLIAERAKLEGIKDNVYLCDTFKGVVKAGIYDSGYKGGEHADTSKEIVDELAAKLKLDNVKTLVGIFPDETSKYVTKERFRFCHVDVDVYQSAKDVVTWIWPKLVAGGIIVYDDYGFRGCGVTKFVNEERKKR